MKKNLLIFGNGDFSKLVTPYLTEKYNISGYVVDDDYFDINLKKEKLLFPLSLVLNKFTPDDYLFFIAIGYKVMRSRSNIYNKLSEYGYSMVNYFSQHGHISKDVHFGKNNIVFPGVVIETGVEIGDNNVFWSNTTICHNTTIGNHNFFAANTTIGGMVNIKDLCFFGFSSTIMQKTTIDNETLVGAMSFINKSTQKNRKYFGIPARLVGEHSANGIIIND